MTLRTPSQLERTGDAARVLVVAEPGVTPSTLAYLLRVRGIEVQVASGRASALALLERMEFHVLLCGERPVVSSELDLVGRARALQPRLQVVTVASRDRATAPDRERLVALVASACERAIEPRSGGRWASGSMAAIREQREMEALLLDAQRLAAEHRRAG